MTKPKHADAVPSVRFIRGRPHLTDDERLELVEERADGAITDTRGLALMLQKDIAERKAFERIIRERTHKHADAMLVLTAEGAVTREAVTRLEKAIGPEPSARESIHDIDEEAVAAIASRGMRGQLAALWATQIAERSARIEESRRRQATEAKQTKAIEATAKAQGRSASLLGGLVVLVTTLQETGALRALLAAIRAAIGV
jgi:hypothetical protein